MSLIELAEITIDQRMAARPTQCTPVHAGLDKLDQRMAARPRSPRPNTRVSASSTNG
jgi:hypothetical protein